MQPFGHWLSASLNRMHQGHVLCCCYIIEKAGLNQNAEIENDVPIRKKRGLQYKQIHQPVDIKLKMRERK